jgi:hypothetical protein
MESSGNRGLKSCETIPLQKLLKFVAQVLPYLEMVTVELIDK